MQTRPYALKFSGPYYKWYLLALMMVTYAVIAGAERMCLPVLFKEISTDLDLSLVSIGTIWGMDPLAGIFTGPARRAARDRFGIKRTLVVVVSWRGFSRFKGLFLQFSHHGHSDVPFRRNSHRYPQRRSQNNDGVVHAKTGWV